MRLIPGIALAISILTPFSVYAADDEVRSDCEYQVQAYGIVNADEYEAAIQDCINSNSQQEVEMSSQSQDGGANN